MEKLKATRERLEALRRILIDREKRVAELQALLHTNSSSTETFTQKQTPQLLRYRQLVRAALRLRATVANDRPRLRHLTLERPSVPSGFRALPSDVHRLGMSPNLISEQEFRDREMKRQRHRSLPVAMPGLPGMVGLRPTGNAPFPAQNRIPPGRTPGRQPLRSMPPAGRPPGFGLLDVSAVKLKKGNVNASTKGPTTPAQGIQPRTNFSGLSKCA